MPARFREPPVRLHLALAGMVACAISVGAGSSLYGQGSALSDDWRWASYSTADGLPDDRIASLTEAANGVTWVGTATGIAWFDGYVWHAMGEESGIPARPVDYLSPDGGDGVLALVHNRLHHGDTTGFRPVPIEADRRVFYPYGAPGLIELNVMGAASLAGGEMLLLAAETDSDTPVLVRVSEGTVTPVDPPAPLDLFSKLSVSRRGDPLLATARGLLRWRAGAWTPVVVFERDATRFAALAENERSEGLAFLMDPASAQGLVAWNADGFTAINGEGRNPVRSLDVAPTGDAMVIYRTGHIRSRIEGLWSTALPTPTEVRESASLIRFAAGNDIWLGTERGLFLYHRGSSRWTTRAFSFPDMRNRVHAILLRGDGSVWTATGDGLVVHRPERDAPESIREILGIHLGTVTGLAEDGTGNVWVTSGSSFRGAFRWDGRQWRRFAAADGLAANQIHAVATDLAGRPWFLGIGEPDDLTTGPGAFVLTEGGFERWGEEEGLLSGRVYGFAEQPDGTRWFATLRGASRWRNGSWTHWDTWRTTVGDGRPLSLPISPRSIAAGRERVWMGDRSIGLLTIDESDSLQFVAVAGALPRRLGVEDVKVEPNGNVWLTTTDGLCVGRGGDWSCLDPSAGLAAAELWPLVVTPQQIYVGTLGRGLQVFNRAEERQPSPRVQLADPLTEGRTALIRWTAHTLRGAIPSDRISTRYRIDDGSWSAWSTTREVTARDLTPGEHSAAVQAMGLLGGTMSRIVTVEFSVQPPVLRRPAVALPLGALLLLLITVGASASRQRRKHMRELEESELRFRALGQAAFEGIGFGEQRSIIEANDRLAEMFGYTRQELTDLDIVDLAAPRSLPLFLQLLSRLKEIEPEDPPLMHEFWARRRDGTEFPVDLQVKAMPYRGRVVRVVAVRDVSGRHEAEAALRTSEEKFAKAFMLSPDAVDLARLEDGRFVDVNEAFLRLCGRDRSDVIGHSGHDLGLWANEAERESYWSRLREGTRVEGFECQLRGKDGRIRDCVISAEHIDVSGDPCVLAVTRDITEQKRVTSALRITQFAVDHAADCVLWLDPDARICYANAAATATYGYTQAEFETLSGFDISENITHETWPKLWAELLTLGSFLRRAVHRDREGHRFPVELVANHVSSEGQEYAVIFARDISERVAAERALRDSEEKFAKAFQMSPDAIAIVRVQDDRILEVNDQFLQLWQRTRDEVLGRTSIELGVFKNESELDHLRNRVVAEGRVSGLPLRVTVGRGEVRMVLLHAVTIDLGDELCVLAVAEDITERQRTSRELERSHQELRVLSRRLMEAQEAERGRISRELHDEVGQALATVKLNLQAIDRLSSDAKVGEQVADGVQIIDLAVEEVRNLSRELRPSVLDDLGLNAALRWLGGRLSERADISVGLDLAEPDERPAKEVETACYRIAQEAVTNVLRHSQGTRVDITLVADAEELTLRIRDDGCGFAPAPEDGPQAADAHLGLIGMRERAANAGGALEIHSSPGAGTQVEARFPLQPFGGEYMAGMRNSRRATLP